MLCFEEAGHSQCHIILQIALVRHGHSTQTRSEISCTRKFTEAVSLWLSSIPIENEPARPGFIIFNMDKGHTAHEWTVPEADNLADCLERLN